MSHTKAELDPKSLIFLLIIDLMHYFWLCNKSNLHFFAIKNAESIALKYYLSWFLRLGGLLSIFLPRKVPHLPHTLARTLTDTHTQERASPHNILTRITDAQSLHKPHSTTRCRPSSFILGSAGTSLFPRKEMSNSLIIRESSRFPFISRHLGHLHFLKEP